MIRFLEALENEVLHNSATAMWDPNINLNLSATAMEPSPVSVNQNLRSDDSTSSSAAESSTTGIKRSSSQSSMVDISDSKKSKVASKLNFASMIVL